MTSDLKVPLLFLAVLMCFMHGSSALFSPNVTIQSCYSHAVVVRLHNAVDGGLVYIQGRGPECSRTTAAGPSDYTFQFDTCQLQYDQKFRVVVQQRPHLQTGDDKVIPVMCLVDTRDLVVTGVIYPEDTSDTAVNKTVKPTVRMAMRAETGDDNVREVTLNDNVKMIVRLDDEYVDDFDLKAKDCTAAFIPVVSDECSSDEELFPNFEKSQQGILTTSFQAFQPTNLEGADGVDVAFTCSVVVCKGTCEKTVCGEIVGWGRRKKRDDDTDDVIERVTIGTKLRVISPHASNSQVGTMTSEYCAEKVVVTTVSTMTVIILLVSWLFCGCILTKLIRLEKKQSKPPKKGGKLRRLSEINGNFARSVGRRLSTILNLPFGYDMRDPRMMDQIPDTYPSPPMKRRDSVTVSTISSNEHTDNDDVSVSSSCACVLRKRLVSFGSQTDSERGSDDNDAIIRIKDADRSRSPVPFDHMNTNPITSLSIQSFSRSFDDVPTNKEKVTTCKPTESLQSCLDPTREYYTADEIPINRENALKIQANVATSHFPSRACDDRSKVTVLDIVRPKTLAANTSTSVETGTDIGMSTQIEDEYASIESMQDVCDVTSGSGHRYGTARPSAEINARASHADRRGSASSILNLLISSSKKRLGRVADALTSYPNKDKFDLNTGSDFIRNTSTLSGRPVGKCRGDPNGSDSIEGNGPVIISVHRGSGKNTAVEREGSLNDIDRYKEENDAITGNGGDQIYEPICFGEQLKPQRKLSTHV